MEQTDRRIRRTRKLLQDALVSLALEKKYDDITIQEITDRADIGYRTFFRHYSDKNELLKDVLQTTISELHQLFTPPPPNIFVDPNVNIVGLMNSTMLFKYVKEHSDLFRVLLFSEQSFIESVIAYMTEEIKVGFGSLLEPGIPFEIIANHIGRAILALVRWWLENDMPYSPEVMGDYAHRLVIQPTRDLIIKGLTE